MKRLKDLLNASKDIETSTIPENVIEFRLMPGRINTSLVKLECDGGLFRDGDKCSALATHTAISELPEHLRTAFQKPFLRENFCDDCALALGGDGRSFLVEIEAPNAPLSSEALSKSGSRSSFSR
jgi:hypothetical protein